MRLTLTLQPFSGRHPTQSAPPPSSSNHRGNWWTRKRDDRKNRISGRTERSRRSRDKPLTPPEQPLHHCSFTQRPPPAAPFVCTMRPKNHRKITSLDLLLLSEVRAKLISGFLNGHPCTSPLPERKTATRRRWLGGETSEHHLHLDSPWLFRWILLFSFGFLIFKVSFMYSGDHYCHRPPWPWWQWVVVYSRVCFSLFLAVFKSFIWYTSLLLVK